MSCAPYIVQCKMISWNSFDMVVTTPANQVQCFVWETYGLSLIMSTKTLEKVDNSPANVNLHGDHMLSFPLNYSEKSHFLIRVDMLQTLQALAKLRELLPIGNIKLIQDSYKVMFPQIPLGIIEFCILFSSDIVHVGDKKMTQLVNKQLNPIADISTLQKLTKHHYEFALVLYAWL